MIELVKRINGYIRHSSRLLQLNRVCIELDIPLLEGDTLHNQHGWFAGFFDADGIVSYSFEGKDQPELTVSLTNKLFVDLVPFRDQFGGQIFFDQAQNGYYK